VPRTHSGIGGRTTWQRHWLVQSTEKINLGAVQVLVQVFGSGFQVWFKMEKQPWCGSKWVRFKADKRNNLGAVQRWNGDFRNR
jgi:hypothetical protein